MGYYGPTDQWPSHSKSWYRKIFKDARSRGWSVDENTSHHTYLLRCPTRDCEELVYSSAKGGETYSKEVAATVRACMHGTGQGDDLCRATELLDKAERLVQAVFTLHDRDRLDASITRALDDEDFVEAEIEQRLHEFDLLAAEAELLLGADADDPGGAVVAAGDALEEARALLMLLPTTASEVKIQRARLNSLRKQVVEARKLIGTS